MATTVIYTGVQGDDLDILAGDPNYDNAVSELNVKEGLIFLYCQNNGDTSDAQLNITPAGVSMIVGGRQRAVMALETSDNYPDDAAAAVGGIIIGELYHNNGAVRIRLS